MGLNFWAVQCARSITVALSVALSRATPARSRRRADLGRGILLVLLGFSVGETGRAAFDGMPLARFYPFEEVGCFAQGAQLAHDNYGRLVVAQQGELIVFNDNAWLKLWEENAGGLNLRKVVRDSRGMLLFGAFGEWGLLEPGPEGSLRPRSLVPPHCPEWVRGSTFDQILCTTSGVYFGGLGGVVHWDPDSGRHHFFALASFASLVPYRGAVYVSTFSRGTFRLDLDSELAVPAGPEWPERRMVSSAAGDGVTSLLLATSSQELHLLRDGRLDVVLGDPARPLPGNVTAMASLPEGGYAVTFAGWGGVILLPDGRVRSSFAGPEYAGITALESHEPGVLWAATEGGLCKILYGEPLTRFGRRSGLPIGWPQIVAHGGTPIVASAGQVFVPQATNGLSPTQFELHPARAPVATWGLAEVGDTLLAANGDGVFALEANQRFLPILQIRAARLVTIDATTCLVIGADEIAALRCGPSGWMECAPRVAGVGYPYIVHGGPNSAWLELGLNRAARISFADGRLDVRVLSSFPWPESNWVNVSLVDANVVLCGSGSVYEILDQQSLQPVDAPRLRRLFAESPHWIQRLTRGEDGALWASYERGVMRVVDGAAGWEFDDRSYAGVNGPTPRVTILPGNDVWAATGSTLYHLQPVRGATARHEARPVLVGVRNSRTTRKAATALLPGTDLGLFDYQDNSLQLDFFAGSYRRIRPFGYEYQMGEGRWQKVTTGSSVLLPDLREGGYQIRVRTIDDVGVPGPAEVVRLTIATPWYRRVYAVAAFVLLGSGLLFAVQRLWLRRVRRRNLELEAQVQARTRELRATMDRLERETQVNATLAERNRLALEIHDTLEQGFTGLALQLETTSGLAGSTREVRAGLGAAMSMIAFCRNEVRQAVRGLHSSALETGDFAAAVQQIATQLVPVPGLVRIHTEGTARPVEPAIAHHLLRIAQEAVANAVKHAAARRIDVAVTYAPGEIRLLVRDDGCGFDPATVLRTENGLGVRSFRSRAAKIGGTVRIDSARGAGTSISVCVPTLPAP